MPGAYAKMAPLSVVNDFMRKYSYCSAGATINPVTTSAASAQSQKP